MKVRNGWMLEFRRAMPLQVFSLILEVVKKARPACGARGGRGGGYSQKNWVGVCGPLPKTLTDQNLRFSLPYLLYDLTKNLIPYL